MGLLFQCPFMGMTVYVKVNDEMLGRSGIDTFEFIKLIRRITGPSCTVRRRRAAFFLQENLVISHIVIIFVQS